VSQLPTFPVDSQTLDLLAQALDPWSNGDPDAASSSLEPFLMMMSQMGGSADAAYSSHDLIGALVAEVRRLRGEGR
jgi:hypothetical protein